MFGFSFESWEQVNDVMYAGVGYEGIWTFFAVVFCIGIITTGAIHEKNIYKKYTK